ncbi:MAG: hypothetical protein BWZ03_00421 [bacterium ADurb.BinA186]|nr:MAG: hypothetical protein BWZ03_00421 [bacterium ADurb.BinA186]
MGSLADRARLILQEHQQKKEESRSKWLSERIAEVEDAVMWAAQNGKNSCRVAELLPNIMPASLILAQDLTCGRLSPEACFEGNDLELIQRLTQEKFTVAFVFQTASEGTPSEPGALAAILLEVSW